MGETIRKQVDGQTLVISFGEMLPGFKKGVLDRLPIAFRSAQTNLDAALVYVSRAAGGPLDRVPRPLRHALNLYFGLPAHPTGADAALYKNALMEIVGRLSRTRHHLAQPTLEIADISDMSWDMCAQVSVINFFSKLVGSRPMEFQGYVYSNALEQFKFKLSSEPIDPIAKPILSGSIHLKLDDFKAATLLRGQTLTLIHEATHKFAGTVDHQYFPDESIFQKFESKAIKYSSESHTEGTPQAPDDPAIEARALLKLNKDHATKQALANVALKKPMEMLGNADSYAHLVMDIVEYLT
jgi:hypothetical protein